MGLAQVYTSPTDAALLAGIVAGVCVLLMFNWGE
jgi:hypothetical protein